MIFKLLVIDDEPAVRYSIEQVFFDDDQVQVLGAQNADEAVCMAAEHNVDVILLDIKLGDRCGLDVLHSLRQIDPKSLVIFITGHGTTDTAIEAMKRGAHDYLVKPLEMEHLKRVVRQAFEISRLMHVPAILEDGPRPESAPDRLIGPGPAMQSICKQIGRVAPQDVNVLILGDSGTGKELVARAIYHHSRRSQATFLAINCAAIPESLLESELFGHERGAFTGADRRRIGKFEQCHGGTLFLDEVGDMAPSTQARILRLLAEGCFERIGGNETIHADVRILAATNQDLEALIDQGRFRKDLYYRLRGVTIHLPPLRDRREDIPELAHYFLFRYNREHGTSVQSIAPAAMAQLLDYSWPGNVRELQSVIRESLLRSSGTTILPEFLPPELLRDGTPEPGAVEPPERSFAEGDWQTLPELLESWLNEGDTDLYRRSLEHFDRLLVSRVLQKADGNQARASEILGLSRVTLRAKMRALGLAVEKVLTPHSNVTSERFLADQ